ncbi:MAG: pyruvate kinase [Spirochaetae bacterium HGW-Spirochaetae-7]|nr:MAG: pyruvate kinase [Spirochaetae bacterium HGW-Spirochaetae-7]
MNSQKLTKIVATISDTNCDPAFLRSLYEAGMNVVRLNTAHQTPEASARVVANIRAVSETIGILVDTKGPEVRVRGLEEPLVLKTGETVTIPKVDEVRKGFSVSYEGFVDEVPLGSRILMDDGTIELVVKHVANGMLLCEVLNDGTLKDRKSVNVPGVPLRIPALSEKDRAYLKFVADNGIDFVAHSFVRNKEDVLEVRRILDGYGSKARIIAKIENIQGVTNLPEILDFADGAMVARGDLGVEIPFERLPGIQKTIIEACVRKGKPVITATQMLHTMIENPRPTRAEVSDVANAVFDGTDALMLSGETAFGKYPLESVRTMARIAMQAESQKPRGESMISEATPNRVRDYLARSVALSALRLPIKAIIADTESGRIARLISSYRSHVPIYAFSPQMSTVRSLSLTFGVFSEQSDAAHTTDQLVSHSLERLVARGAIETEDLVAIIGGSPGQSETTNFLEINTAASCLGHPD